MHNYKNIITNQVDSVMLQKRGGFGLVQDNQNNPADYQYLVTYFAVWLFVLSKHLINIHIILIS